MICAIPTVALAVVRSCGTRLGAQDHLCCGPRVKVHVLIKADVRVARRPVEHLHWNFGQVLSTEIQVHDAVDAFRRLSLNDLIFWKSRVQVHDLRLQSLGLERSFNPIHEIAIDIRL
jgi:hypothetical protein